MAKDTDRNPDGTFKRKDEGSGSEGATERKIENVQTSGGEEERAEYIESLDRPGLGEEQAGSKIEQLMEAAAQEPEEVPDDVDPSELEAARRALEEEGSIEAAQDAIEQNLQQSEAEEAREATEGPEPVPFEHLAQDIGFEDPRQAAEAVTVTAKVDGEEIEMPLSEAVQGYQRQEAFTKKTQELAEKRKEAEAKGEEYAQGLELIATTIGNRLPPEAQQQLVAEYNRVVSEVSDAATPDPETVEQEREKLQESLGIESEEDWHETRQNLRSYAHDLGYGDEDLARVTDHRLLEVLEKARRYDEISGSMEGLEDTRKRTPTLKPGVNRRTADSVERTRQRRQEEGRRGHKSPALKMSSSDTVDDAADRIAGILAGEE